MPHTQTPHTHTGHRVNGGADAREFQGLVAWQSEEARQLRFGAALSGGRRDVGLSVRGMEVALGREKRDINIISI